MQTEPTTVYYNSASPVCDAGIASQKNKMSGCNIAWVDVHQHPERVKDLGVELEFVRERLHVKDEAGRTLVGAAALVALWDKTPSQRAWAQVARWPGLGVLIGWGYNIFAKLLYRWNRLRHRW